MAETDEKRSQALSIFANETIDNVLAVTSGDKSNVTCSHYSISCI